MSISNLRYDTCTIHQHEIGQVENYLYLIQDHATNKLAVVDPAWEPAKILRLVDELGGELSMILITHSHGDHVNAVADILEASSAQVHISAAEAEFWPAVPDDAVRHQHGDTLQLGETTIEWLVTAGHTPGSSCFRIDQALVAADTLFMFGCGRCDMPGGDPRAMYRSLQMLKRLIPADTVIYPGHDYGDRPYSTMSEQLAGNPFLHWDSESAFVQYRMVDHEKTRSSPYTALTAAEIGAD